MLSLSHNRPNVIVLLADALRADRLNCCGYARRMTSPRLDELAGSGVLFENAIASAPWTLPSHGSLFTGKFPTEHGATDETLWLRDEHNTLAQALAEAGYLTLAFSPHNGWLSTSTNVMRGFAVHLGPEDATGVAAGFGRGNGEPGLGPEGTEIVRFTEYALRRTARNTGPLFLFLHAMITHAPYCPAPEAWQTIGEAPPDGKIVRYLQSEFKTYRTRPETLDGSQLQALNRLYDASVATFDQVCARIAGLVEQHLGWDNTLLVVTSDHGQNLGDHGFVSHWLCLFDTLVRVPLLILPRRDGACPRRVTRVAQQSDLFHTLLDAAGVEGHEEQSLLNRAAGRFPWEREAFSEHARPDMTLQHIRKANPGFSDTELEAPKRAVRTDTHKYILHATGSEFLYDLQADPAETRDVSGDEPHTVAAMREALERRLGAFETPAGDRSQKAELDGAVLNNLQALGYM